MSSDIASYAIPPAAAAVSIVPPFYFLAKKSAQQTGSPMPTAVQVLKGSAKAVPTVGAMVGLQMIAQEQADKKCQEIFGSQGMLPKLASSGAVAVASSPILAIFNGQTMGYKWFESLYRLTAKQVAAISAREMTFLGALALSKPISEKMKKRFGDNQAVGVASSFGTGALGSLFGHIPDTCLSRWQKGLTVENVSQLGRGVAPRAIGLGLFTALYQYTKDKMDRCITLHKLAEKK